MAYGTHDFQFLDFGDQDVNRIASRQTARGVSFANILTAANNAMAATTQNLDPLVGALTVQTDGTDAEEDYSAVFQLEYGSEYAVARPQRSEGITHQLPIRKLDVASQFTEDFLDNATEARIAAHLDGLTRAFQSGYEAMALDALFNPTAVPVTENSSTLSPKLIGYDSSDPAYGRVTLADGTVVASPYSHYLNDTEANLAAAIQTAKTRLMARGATGPFDIAGSADAVAAISELDNFVNAGDPLVRNGMGTAEAAVDQNVYAGVLQGMNIRVRHANDRISSADGFHFAVFKTNGQFASGNVVAWRYDGNKGVTPVLRSRSLYPLDYATAINRAGFGINNRFGAVAVHIETTAGGYDAPTISG